ncbi:hypothetical protein BX600DRAFT_467697 [Xylariales sp. PMI_506]|nr:hypothetical protein BX600DRAFT_467697 [Xylariales sp. PMI_506]
MYQPAQTTEFPLHEMDNKKGDAADASFYPQPSTSDDGFLNHGYEGANGTYGAGFQQWPPSYAAPVFKPLPTLVGGMIIDTILFLVSVCFLTFGWIAHHYNEAPVDEHPMVTSGLTHAANLGPTILPIIFATVVGRACRAAFAWRLEVGANIGTLDLLAGSTSLSSAVVTQLTLRIFTFLSPILIAVWAMSPVGSQASLRLVSLAQMNSTQPHTYSYMTQNSTYENYMTADIATQAAVVSGLFQAALLAPSNVKSSPRDMWANAKTPMIEYFEDSDLSPDENGWYSVEDMENVTYTSLIGTPISNMSSGASFASLDLETSYWVLDCPVVVEGTTPNGLNLTSWNVAGASTASLLSNTSLVGRGQVNASSIPSRWISYTAWNNDAADEDSTKTSSLCSITTSYINMQIGCQGTSCFATHIRRSNLSNPDPNWTYLDQTDLFLYFSSGFTNLITGHTAEATSMQIYFTDPDDPYNFGNYTDVWEIGSKLYGLRLGQLLNTYWTAAAGFVDISQGLFAPTGAYGGATAVINTSDGAAIVEKQVLRRSRLWLGWLTIASLVMIAASLMHPVLHFFVTENPSIDINLSSLARDNPYMRTHMIPSCADATTRSHMLRGHRVRLGDVLPESEVGHLTIGSIEGGNMVHPVQRGRLYA